MLLVVAVCYAMLAFAHVLLFLLLPSFQTTRPCSDVSVESHLVVASGFALSLAASVSLMLHLRLQDHPPTLALRCLAACVLLDVLLAPVAFLFVSGAHTRRGEPCDDVNSMMLACLRVANVLLVFLLLLSAYGLSHALSTDVRVSKKRG